MPTDIKISITLKQRRISWEVWAMIAWLFGLGSFASRFTWWFLEPVVIHTEKTGWIATHEPESDNGWRQGCGRGAQ